MLVINFHTLLITSKACYYQKLRKVEAGMKMVNNALSALMRDKIDGYNYYEKGVPKCLLLR